MRKLVIYNSRRPFARRTVVTKLIEMSLPPNSKPTGETRWYAYEAGVWTDPTTGKKVATTDRGLPRTLHM